MHGGVLFIDRRWYVNSDGGQLLWMVGCPTQAEAAYCLLYPTGKKAREKERDKYSFPLLHARLSLWYASHPHASASVFWTITSYIPCILEGSARQSSA